MHTVVESERGGLSRPGFRAGLIYPHCAGEDNPGELVYTRSLKHIRRPTDIGINAFEGALEGDIYVGYGCQVIYRLDPLGSFDELLQLHDIYMLPESPDGCRLAQV